MDSDQMLEAIERAHASFGEAIRRTPLIRSPALEKTLNSKHPIFLKAENLQFTGSFKVRGALNKLIEIQDQARARGVIAASAGNHAQGVAFHAKRLGIEANIVMPVNSPLIKVRATRQLGANVILHGESYQEAFDHCLKLQKEKDYCYVHAFDDEAVIAGQGTIAKEVLEDCPEVRTFICPIGGGGLAAGCGSYLKAKRPDLKLYAFQAEGSNSYLASLKAGKIVKLEQVETIAEGMAVKQLGEKCFPLLKRVVDDCVLVSDSEIAQGILWLLENEKLYVEGCGGGALATLFKRPDLIQGPTVVLLSGGNLDVNLLSRIIQQGLVRSGRRVRLETSLADRPGSLQLLLQAIASEGASIMEIKHERIFAQTGLMKVAIHIELETNGPEHMRQVRAGIDKAGFSARFL